MMLGNSELWWSQANDACADADSHETRWSKSTDAWAFLLGLSVCLSQNLSIWNSTLLAEQMKILMDTTLSLEMLVQQATRNAQLLV